MDNHQQRIVHHVSGTEELMNECVCGGPWPCTPRSRVTHRMATSSDPVERETLALAKRAGFDWYDTESSARHMAGIAANEILELRAKLEAFDALRELCGYVGDGSQTRVTIDQDDATRAWSIQVGKKSWVYGNTLALAIKAAKEQS